MSGLMQAKNAMSERQKFREISVERDALVDIELRAGIRFPATLPFQRDKIAARRCRRRGSSSTARVQCEGGGFRVFHAVTTELNHSAAGPGGVGGQGGRVHHQGFADRLVAEAFQRVQVRGLELQLKLPDILMR